MARSLVVGAEVNPQMIRNQERDEAVDETEKRKHEDELREMPERRLGRADDEQAGPAEPYGNFPGPTIGHDAPHERSGFFRPCVRNHDRHAVPESERGRAGHRPASVEKTVFVFVPGHILRRVVLLQDR